MEKFNRALRGYDPDEVNEFLDQVIKQVEKMVKELKNKDKVIAQKDAQIEELTAELDKSKNLSDKLAQYQRMEGTLNRAIVMAQKTSDQIKTNAYKERDMILESAKKNANHIINESLLKAEKAEMEAYMLKRNIKIFKKKIRGLVETQLDLVDDIEKIEL